MITESQLKDLTIGDLRFKYGRAMANVAALRLDAVFGNETATLAADYYDSEAATLLAELQTRRAATRLVQLVKIPNRV